MNIADKILRAKADLDSVYDAGVEKGRGEATDGVIVEPLEVAANGTYTAPNGVAYSPVKVNVPDVNGSYDEGYEDGYEKGKVEPKYSEGLEFMDTYINVMWGNKCGVTGMGTCTDTILVVPCAASDWGAPVVSVGRRDDLNNTVGIDVQGVSKIYLPDTVLEVVPSGLQHCDALKYIKFGRYFDWIGDSQFSQGNPPTDLVLDFSDYARNTLPYLSDTSLADYVGEVRVPSAMVDQFKTATNWARMADKIVGV